MTINVHSYESMGTFDGPGLRLVVFLQGCPFRCLYCANPDTIDVKGGTPTTPEEILQMAISQKAFFGKKGGITFSGGEPTLQAEALIPLFKELKANGIHICLDSNGGIWNEKVEELFNLTDLVLLDIKQFNPERHRTLTGRSNEQTLRTAAWLEEHEHPFWLRGSKEALKTEFRGMYWSPVTAIRKKTPACWVKVLANTSRYNGWKYFLITVWVFTNTKPWDGITN